MSKISSDLRIDPRIRAAFRMFPMPELKDVDSREQVLKEENSLIAKARNEAIRTLVNSFDYESVAPSRGLKIESKEIESQPDRNTIRIQIIRPENDEVIPCVYYIHGGGMAFMSCYYGNYSAFGRMIARRGISVCMVDFRNSISPSSVAEVAPFPAGLNDCISGLRWVHENASELKINPGKIVVAGESGGGNLTLATSMKLLREGDIGLINGVYALCPYIAGSWPQEKYPSSIENNGILIDLHNNRMQMGYGIEELHKQNPLAWPGFATAKDVKGLPKTVISVNELDPLRDEGIAFYRMLMQSGVPARCRQVMGTIHGTEVFPVTCPEISQDTASHIASFAMED